MSFFLFHNSTSQVVTHYLFHTLFQASRRESWHYHVDKIYISDWRDVNPAPWTLKPHAPLYQLSLIMIGGNIKLRVFKNNTCYKEQCYLGSTIMFST